MQVCFHVKSFTNPVTNFHSTRFDLTLETQLRYGVALVSRIDTIIGLFGKRALQKRQYSAKETYNLSILLTVATPYPYQLCWKEVALAVNDEKKIEFKFFWREDWALAQEMMEIRRENRTFCGKIMFFLRRDWDVAGKSGCFAYTNSGFL